MKNSMMKVSTDYFVMTAFMHANDCIKATTELEYA
jgi:hypothetical protein